MADNLRVFKSMSLLSTITLPGLEHTLTQSDPTRANTTLKRNMQTA